MWTFTTDGYLSAVQDRTNPDLLQVRARERADLLAHFPACQVLDTPGADYAFRALVNRRVVADVLYRHAMTLSYDGHAKEAMAAASPPNPERMHAYYRVWSAMAELQDPAPYSLTPRPPRTRWDDDYPEDDPR